MLGDTVNERAVCILLECNLVIILSGSFEEKVLIVSTTLPIRNFCDMVLSMDSMSSGTTYFMISSLS